MAESTIQWTDRVWNFLRGCTMVSEGCRRCYAMKQAHRFNHPGGTYEGLTELGPDGPRWNNKVRVIKEKIAEPLSVKKPQKWFVNSMSDLFHEDVPFEVIAEAFGVMAVAGQKFWSGRKTHRVGTRTEAGKSPKAIMAFGDLYGPHVFQILTKRPERMRSIISNGRFQVEVSRHAYRHAPRGFMSGIEATRETSPTLKRLVNNNSQNVVPMWERHKKTD